MSADLKYEQDLLSKSATPQFSCNEQSQSPGTIKNTNEIFIAVQKTAIGKARMTISLFNTAGTLKEEFQMTIKNGQLNYNLELYNHLTTTSNTNFGTGFSQWNLSDDEFGGAGGKVEIEVVGTTNSGQESGNFSISATSQPEGPHSSRVVLYSATCSGAGHYLVTIPVKAV